MRVAGPTCCWAALASLFAQDRTPPSLPQEPTLRITVNLVQVDAVVTDAHGRQVTNLSGDDFEVLEDGRTRKITACTYVRISDVTVRHSSQRSGAQLEVPRNEAKAIPEQVQRTIVLLVDDLNLSIQSIVRLRKALGKFVDEQMRDGDLVSLVRTRGGMGSLAQFTMDKRVLHAAIDHVRYATNERAAALKPIGYDQAPNASTMTMSRGGVRQTQDSGPGQRTKAHSSGTFNTGALGAISFVIGALRDLPGRKAIMLFSDGMPSLWSSDEGMHDALRHLTDLANRSAVVLYAVDARGLQTLGLTAADDTNPRGIPMTPQELAAVPGSRGAEFLGSQEGLDYLAHETGGFLIHGTNSLAGGIARALEDMSGYYLIGYKPDESAFELENGARRFHKIEVRVRQTGLRVRSRTGYFGVADEAAAASVSLTPTDQLRAALRSPFYSSALNLRLTCLFSEPSDHSAAVRMLVYVDGRELTFGKQPDGSHEAIVDVAALAIGEQGLMGASGDRRYTIRLPETEFEEASASGLVFKLNVNLNTPGAYQMRAALRDAGSGRIGSAGQFVEAPEFREQQLAVSGIIMNGRRARGSGKDWDSSGIDYGIALPGTAAVRAFHSGDAVSFGFVIFDARAELTTGRSKVETRLNLYRDGERIHTSSVASLNWESPGSNRLVATGTLRLARELQPGEYVFEAVAYDPLAPRKHRTAVQWIDLEVVK